MSTNTRMNIEGGFKFPCAKELTGFTLKPVKNEMIFGLHWSQYESYFDGLYGMTSLGQGGQQTLCKVCRARIS